MGCRNTQGFLRTTFELWMSRMDGWGAVTDGKENGNGTVKSSSFRTIPAQYVRARGGGMGFHTGRYPGALSTTLASLGWMGGEWLLLER